MIVGKLPKSAIIFPMLLANNAEIVDYTTGKITKPMPRKCGEHQQRIKWLLPKHGIIVMYRDTGTKLVFYGATEPGNKIHLELFTGMLSDAKLNHTE